MDKPKHPGGRPTDYNDEVAGRICKQIMHGLSMRKICAADDMPCQGTVYEWLARHKEFAEQYLRAKAVQVEHLVEEMMEIADDPTGDSYEDEDGNQRTNYEVIARSKLRVDTRKWYASKLAPKIYGDRLSTEHTGKDGGAINVILTQDDSKL